MKVSNRITRVVKKIRSALSPTPQIRSSILSNTTAYSECDKKADLVTYEMLTNSNLIEPSSWMQRKLLSHDSKGVRIPVSLQKENPSKIPISIRRNSRKVNFSSVQYGVTPNKSKVSEEDEEELCYRLHLKLYMMTSKKVNCAKRSRFKAPNTFLSIHNRRALKSLSPPRGSLEEGSKRYSIRNSAPESTENKSTLYDFFARLKHSQEGMNNLPRLRRATRD